MPYAITVKFREKTGGPTAKVTSSKSSLEEALQKVDTMVNALNDLDQVFEGVTIDNEPEPQYGFGR